MEGISNKDIYRCYDENLRYYLYLHGIKYFLTAFDVKTKAQFWAYYKSAKFKDVLDEWVDKNPKNNLIMEGK